MLSLDQAQAAIFARIVRATRYESASIEHAAGRILARIPDTVVDNPAFDNSAMDGYAYNTADFARLGGKLPLRGESSCGSAPGTLTPGTTMRIFTGAPLPAGADAVAIQEVVQVRAGIAEIPESASQENNIRRRGEDFRRGEPLFPVGHRISPLDIALLSAAGRSHVEVFAPPRVLVIATGNELVPPGMPLKPGQIYESNRVATIASLRAIGAEVVDGGTVIDDPVNLRAAMAVATNFDFVITSGGASVGDHDLVKQVFAESGSIEFWRVKIKPGKPIAFGRLGEHTHFFALPGNPVSSLITFRLFVAPSITTWSHGTPRELQLRATATHDFKRSPGRMEFLRARLSTENGQLMAQALPGQGSHMLGTLRNTNGLIRMDEESAGFKRGDSVTAIPLTLDIT